jgi:hypothetical protein
MKLNEWFLSETSKMLTYLLIGWENAGTTIAKYDLIMYVQKLSIFLGIL